MALAHTLRPFSAAQQHGRGGGQRQPRVCRAPVELSPRSDRSSRVRAVSDALLATGRAAAAAALALSLTLGG